MGFDIIGDVHGYGVALKGMLAALGYEQTENVWRHPERHLIFVGDLIDRGSLQLECVAIARRMQEAGTATVLMGNHELNAIGWATEWPDGRPARPHSPKNRQQHSRFLEAVGEESPLHREIVSWFKTLPLWLDQGPFGVVHACWHTPSMDILAPLVRPDSVLTEEGFARVFVEGDPVFEAAEILLKGIELPLPNGAFFRDKDRHERRSARIKWWDRAATTYRLGAIGVEDPEMLPDSALPAEILVTPPGKPVFFGHYWLNGAPMLQTQHYACLDFSIAQDGVLCAYRWDGEAVLDASKLIAVAADGKVVCDWASERRSCPHGRG
ncbi:hypothetical protein FHS85_004487 [Rhodoligotrophos appendicifer]|uniref:metallophosphoesterase n=1 Tax=Rhodoligotrophos appendicifer TaxID=987056 RepID=UPI001186EAB8|nr:metallophosphoesterase [Rhodoligotrophos appendicifer]